MSDEEATKTPEENTSEEKAEETTPAEEEKDEEPKEDLHEGLAEFLQKIENDLQHRYTDQDPTYAAFNGVEPPPLVYPWNPPQRASHWDRSRSRSTDRYGGGGSYPKRGRYDYRR